MGNRSRFGRLALAIAGAALLVQCGGGGSTSSSGSGIGQYISRITAGNGFFTAVRSTGAPPAASGGPTAGVNGATTAINGGTAQLNVTANSSFNRVYLAVPGVDGYYTLNLPTAVTSTNLLLTINRHLSAATLDLDLAVADAGGATGAPVSHPLSLTTVGSGDVQVSVSWDSLTDVDLHVIDPNGDEVYYGNTPGASGTLDLDSNPACAIDGVNNENITFPTAPHGTYTVRVDYWDACGVTQTNYVVTVQRAGHSAETFTGNLTGLGDAGGAGSGTLITTFTFP
jgi:pre-peptidase